MHVEYFREREQKIKGGFAYIIGIVTSTLVHLKLIIITSSEMSIGTTDALGTFCFRAHENFLRRFTARN